MKNCEEIDQLVTPFVDHETDAQTSADIEAHLAACPPCRAAADAERATRAAIRARREELCGAAPPHLRNRCAGAAVNGAMAAGGRSRTRRWMTLAAAATVVLVTGGIIVSAMSARLDAALAAQLTIDHFKCFALAGGRQAAVDAQEAAAALTSRYGWTIAVPPSDAGRDLTLIEARRCLYLDGSIAHLLYRRGGRALSLFVIPHTARRERLLEVMGHDAIIWAEGDQTFAMVGREGPAAMKELSAYVRATRVK